MGSALCAAIALTLHMAGGLLLLIALVTEPEGPWDTGVTTMVRWLGTAVLVVEVLAAGFTAVVVGLRPGRRLWWYALPAAFALTAIVRMVFAPTP
ncbi:hypothetical protein ACIBCM_14570 [Streptomyces sp. NPDC051018]|uniref:hypothetical protein n=1 Tax=Streptomyces sp. NPDC051018 TaxID=3365639 RepID=UPI0037958CB4